MDTKPFVDAFQEVNSRLIGLVGSLSALRELSSFETSSKNEYELLTASLEVVIENLDLDYVVIHEQKDDELGLVASVGWEMMDEKDQLTHQAILQTLAENVLQNDGNYNNSSIMDKEQGSFITLPVAANHELIGVLSACHPHHNFFTVEHERSLIIFCNFLAQLVVNNRFIMKMEDLVHERTSQLERALYEAQLLKVRYETLSVIDELTELHNRRFFFPESRAVLARAVRYKEDLSVLLLDIDRFKSINDRYGHAVGDEVLKDVAKLLKEEAREADIVARFGGEEFVLLLPMTGIEGALILAERIREKVKNLNWQVAEDAIAITVSIGVSEFQSENTDDMSDSLDELIKQADIAMYHSKDQGRDQVTRYADVACPV